MLNIERIVDEFFKENGLETRLSFNMPIGYETAFGTYDVTINTLFFNNDMLSEAPEFETLFFLFHELRHALQYNFPEKFDREIQESLPYVILYDGTCFKLSDNLWQQCTIDGTDDYLETVYKSLPYEIDANRFAYEKTKGLCGDIAELKEIADLFLPRNPMHPAELKEIFKQIDEKLK